MIPRTGRKGAWAPAIADELRRDVRTAPTPRASGWPAGDRLCSTASGPSSRRSAAYLAQAIIRWTSGSSSPGTASAIFVTTSHRLQRRSRKRHGRARRPPAADLHLEHQIRSLATRSSRLHISDTGAFSRGSEEVITAAAPARQRHRAARELGVSYVPLTIGAGTHREIASDAVPVGPFP